MRNEKLLQVTNLMSDDDMAETAYYIRDNFYHKLVLMTVDGIAIVRLILNGEFVDVNKGESEDITDSISNGFGLVVQNGKERCTVMFDEDCDIISNESNLDISIDSVSVAGTMEELSELVSDGEVEDTIFDILDEMQIMIG